VAIRRLKSYLIAPNGPSVEQIDGEYVPCIDINDDTGELLINGKLPVNYGSGWTVPGSGGSSSFLFTQSVPQSTWTVVHNLNRLPSVTIVDSTGREILADVHYDSNNQVTISMSAPIGGTAYLV